MYIQDQTHKTPLMAPALSVHIGINNQSEISLETIDPTFVSLT